MSPIHLTVLLGMCLLTALFKESQAGGKSNFVSDHKMWKSRTFPKWKGDKYFEESSKNKWVEVENSKVVHEYTLVSKASAQVVLKRIDESNSFIKLLPGMAWHGKELNDITGIVERGDWECSHCRLPSREAAEKFIYTKHNFTLVNDLAYPVRLTWIDTQGSTDMSPFISIGAGVSTSQMSHRGHRWLISSKRGDDIEIHLGHGYFRDSKSVVDVSQLQ